ncbi:hypothetical protein KIW84_050178 [Lathyrus oleraceus]|uniref:DUF4216 domain-containing protein n=1 Tax=Pisum sativum TaxID=3888 RepID=A0A9D5AC23_PEA|nr:hypothetical protein KIW84_050178 [Pisum sativum]
MTGDQIFEKVKDLDTQFGKPFAHTLVKSGWKKRSVFFELPYWKSLYVRHFLDVMHIEKNVFESVIGTLLNIQGKSKDGLKARKDLIVMGIRTELGPLKKGKRTYLPPAAYTLSRKEKKTLCKFLSEVKVPEGYSSDIRRLVSMKDLKLKSLKTHDCHVIMEHFLPIGQQNCTVCFLEKQTQHMDLDVKLNVVTFMPDSICYIVGYVKNRSRPEGCMVERYIVEEAIEFCTEYLSNVQSIGLPKSQLVEKKEGKNLIGNKIVAVSRVERDQVHLYVLHNENEVGPYVEIHKDVLRDPASITERLRCLAYGPSFHVFSYSAYAINGYTFYTKEQDDKSTMQNSGVTVVAEAMHISSIPIFGCKWVENNNGIRMDKSGFLQVDLNRVGYKDESFILASQARQVFYVNDPKSTKWSIVLFSNKVIDENTGDQGDIDVEIESFTRNDQDENIISNDSYIRNDHNEGKMAIMKSIIRARGKGYLKVSIDICLDGDVPLSSSLIRVDDDAGYLKVSLYDNGTCPSKQISILSSKDKGPKI